MSKTFIAISALVGTVIGAGFLGIPYVSSKSGFPLALVSLFFLAIILLICKLYLGEIILSTKTIHQLPGYAERYLGKKGKILMFLAFIFGIYSAILAYLIAEGQSLSYLFFGTDHYSFILGISFWLVMSALCFFGIKALKKGESVGLILVLIMIISVTAISWHHININNLTYVNYKQFFAPFGVILFAFLGFSIIPEIRKILYREENKMKKSIIYSYIIAFLVYAIFTAVVLGSQGKSTPELATVALGPAFIFLGMITMLTSYLALSVALMDTLKYDFKKPKVTSWLYTIIVPLVLYSLLEIFKKANFTKVLGIGGVLSGGLTAILILIMIKKAKQKRERFPEYHMIYSKILNWILIAIFVIGAILEIIYVFR